MPKYEVLNPIAYSGRRERGEVVDLSRSAAEQYGDDYVRELREDDYVLDEEQETEEAHEQPQDDYDEQSAEDLKELCRERDLKVGGSRSELIERLRESDNETEEQETEE